MNRDKESERFYINDYGMLFLMLYVAPDKT